MNEKEFWDFVHRAQRMIFLCQFEAMSQEERRETEKRAYMMIENAVVKRQNLLKSSS